ncbi:hypothetical protein GEV33_005835 [Tenebrio molitor]|uniref:Uncharacterized protein n=1 Tax=Tenebrio molitor TaxID=7067 RepID=A0A8J6HN00_TENMO|nr:hypothetical protein GEV33_005835 [Tenebrio molitor]
MGLWKNEWWDKRMQGRKASSKKETKKLEKRKSNEGRVQESTQEVQISMQREEGKETDGRRNEDEAYKDGRRVSDRITMEEWRKYFSELLGREENRQEKEKRQHRVGEIEEITREELEQQLRKLKRKKAPGMDGIQNESWIYGTEREVDRLLEIMNGVWKGEGFPQEWKEGIICPIYKKGEKDTASNYRGITLLNTAYKVYAMIVEERLMKEMNERGVLPDGQAGFRKAREEKGMKEMLGSMEKYMRRKKLTVNVEKSKMMVFRKGGGRRKINEWRWEKDKIEEVKEFKYLGYVMNERNTAAAHVRELVKKANKIIGAVWGIGMRKFGHDFRRRIMMFDSLVKSVMMYGAEIWGWREQEGLEGVQGKYLKWVLGVDRETPGYIVMEETKRDGIRIEAGKRAIRFEERVIERGECRILQECLKEKRKEIGKGVWKEREAYFERNGYAGAEIERMREGGRAMTDELVQRDRDVQVQERRTRIRESRYSGKYEKIITEELPKYLGRESRKERVIIARFRCGNEERENKYWNEDRIRVCRMCGEKKETIEHLLNECVELRERDESREEMLNEDGRGIEWMKNIEWRRRTICGEG